MNRKQKAKSIMCLIFLIVIACTSNYEKGEKEFAMGNYQEAQSYYILIPPGKKDYPNAQIRILEIDSLEQKDKFDLALKAVSDKRYSDAELLFLKLDESGHFYRESKVILSRIDSIKRLWVLAREKIEKERKLEEEKIARHKRIEEEKATRAKRIEDEKTLKQIKQKVRALFNSLLVFKDKSDFHFYGFGVAYKYNKWLKDVQHLKSTPEAKLLLGHGFSVGDLEMLGLEYSGTRGQETEYSKWAKKIISDGLREK